MHWIDLHTHSNASDGALSPAQLTAHAQRRGLDAVALTDHDTVDGLDEALASGAELGLEVVQAIRETVGIRLTMVIPSIWSNSCCNLKCTTRPALPLREGRNLRNKFRGGVNANA